MRLVTLGVGARRSPRYAPAGLLVAVRDVRIMLDGGPGAEPSGSLDAWLVTDEHGELMPQIRRLARRWGLTPAAEAFERDGLTALPRPVVHTNHPAYGYLIEQDGTKVAWAPEFLQFPRWAHDVDLLFAEAAGWSRPIRFRGGAGGHLDALAVARAARKHGVKRLVFAHIGRPTIRAMDRGEQPPFGEFARDGQIFRVGAKRR
jgi:hypothetical protein